MRKRIIMFCATLVTLVLEILPYGAVCLFANPAGESWRKTYSYFDLTPFGYAHFSPLITGILTCVLFVLLIVSLVTKRKLQTSILWASAMATAISIFPISLGIEYISIVGILISALLFITALLAFLSKRNNNVRF